MKTTPARPRRAIAALDHALTLALALHLGRALLECWLLSRSFDQPFGPFLDRYGWALMREALLRPASWLALLATIGFAYPLCIGIAHAKQLLASPLNRLDRGSAAQEELDETR
jgi:hypothetical protein